jgi:hypothetical protein
MESYKKFGAVGGRPIFRREHKFVKSVRHQIQTPNTTEVLRFIYKLLLEEAAMVSGTASASFVKITAAAAMAYCNTYNKWDYRHTTNLPSLLYQYMSKQIMAFRQARTVGL